MITKQLNELRKRGLPESASLLQESYAISIMQRTGCNYIEAKKKELSIRKSILKNK